MFFNISSQLCSSKTIFIISFFSLLLKDSASFFIFVKSNFQSLIYSDNSLLLSSAKANSSVQYHTNATTAKALIFHFKDLVLLKALLNTDFAVFQFSNTDQVLYNLCHIVIVPFHISYMSFIGFPKYLNLLIAHFSFRKKYQSRVSSHHAITAWSAFIKVGGIVFQFIQASEIIIIGQITGSRYGSSFFRLSKNGSSEVAASPQIAIIGNLSNIPFINSGDFFANSFICFKNALASLGLLNSKSKLSHSLETFEISIDSDIFLKGFRFNLHRAILAWLAQIFSRFLLKSCKALSIQNQSHLFFKSLKSKLCFDANQFFILFDNQFFRLSKSEYFSTCNLVFVDFSKSAISL
jgi:hypothetical protein